MQRDSLLLGLDEMSLIITSRYIRMFFKHIRKGRAITWRRYARIYDDSTPR